MTNLPDVKYRHPDLRDVLGPNPILMEMPYRPDQPVERRITTFAAETLTPALVGELTPLLRDHYAEVAHYQDIPLKVDWKGYFLAHNAGALRMFTVRDGEGELVGYAVFFVKANLHYADSLQALQDVIFLDRPARGHTGAKFVKWCDDRLRAEGVQVVYHHVKAAHDWGKMLERQGYELVDTIWGKRLDR